MSDDIRWQKPPRPWEIVARDANGRPAALRIGQRQVDLAAVVRCRCELVSTPNMDGHVLAVASFLITGALFVLPVVMSLLEPRFLLGGVLCFAIGLSSLGEMRRIHRIEVYNVHLDREDGTTETFTAADPAEAAALVAALEAAGISAAGR